MTEGESPEKPAVRREFRRKVPRPIRRALLLLGWVSATVLLCAEVVVSIRSLL